MNLFFLGYFASCIGGTPQITLGIAIPMIMPLLLFGGFFLENGSAPDYLNWISYLSWFMYGNEALSINQWKDVQFNNTDCQYIGYNISNLPPGTPPDFAAFVTGLYTAYEENVACSGDDILEMYNFNPV